MKRFNMIYLLLVWGFFSAGSWGSERTLYLLYTNNTNGALENCYCPDHPLGSMEKRVVFVEQFVAEHPNTIILDAGDFFSVTARPLKDSLISVAYSMIPYDALLLGDQELSKAGNYLEELLPYLNAPLVVANLQAPSLPEVVPYRIITRDGLRIAIVGVLGPGAFKYYSQKVKEQVALKDPVATIKGLEEELRQQANLIIVLSHRGLEPDRRMAEALPWVTAIVGGHTQSVLEEPVRVGDVFVLQAGKEGYYVGVLELKLDDGNRVISGSGYLEAMTLERPDDPRIMKLIEEYEQRTGFINRRKLRLKSGDNH